MEARTEHDCGQRAKRLYGGQRAVHVEPAVCVRLIVSARDTCRQARQCDVWMSMWRRRTA